MNIKTGEITLKNPDADDREQPKPFTFDQVYDHTTKQEFLFETTAQPIIDCVIQGYNGTVFAYGQTGTGKSHTMEGQWEPPDLRGIIPRAFCHIFERIEDTHDQNFLVRASYLEIYNEEVRDLLSKDPKNRLEIKEDVERGVYVKELTSYVVKGVSEMENVLLAGKKNRSVGATLMNQDSSRSHSIFSIVIESSATGADGEKHIKAGKLNLVDLAGSERQSKTGATGDRLKEATKINLSLSALGNVISALVDSKTSHIPYRDSKLTRLLQDSLGGNTKTVMVANLGPADYNYDETSSTLRYANRAKNIKNKPKINEDPKDAMLREFQEEIQRLREALEKQHGKGGAAPAQVSASAMTSGGTQGQVVRQMTNDQLDQVNLQLAKQKEELVNAEKISEEEREKAEEEIKKKEEMLACERMERQRLAAQLTAMEEKLVMGHADEDTARQKEEELIRAQVELEERRLVQDRLNEQLREKEELAAAAEEKFSSVQDEATVKTKKLKKLWSRYEETKGEVHELQKEFQQEKEDLLDTIREQDRQLKLLNLIVTNFVPPEEKRKIERRCRYDEDASEWKVEQASTLGATTKRPISAVTGAKRPSSAVARAAHRLGSDNPRFRGENIIQLELDMPDRTTRDYEERDMETEGMEGMAVPSMPNVFFSFPDEGNRSSGAATGWPKSRATSSADRAPGSRSTNRPASARKGRSPTVESQAEAVEDFPSAQGFGK
eukprot:CAMPEP_0179417520 /NCGR_PEP_ID=MMETSP0799-20121207/7412_1 /TAXON_ID=46947 /ORGANISM="Geminigera cryophila, Strain CCMP2564" /LENGTH=722 /DNA_ID=CAMNT_0021190537 /DNA_START=61 /DNA_END=2229 /DNA_ORIENTATION=-